MRVRAEPELVAEHFGARTWPGALALASGLACALACVLVLRGRRPAGPALALRLWFAVAVLAAVGVIALLQPFHMTLLGLALSAAHGILALGVLLAPWLRARVHARALRGADFALFTACTALVGIELGLRALARVHPSPVLARAAGRPRDRIEHNRYPAGQLRYGFPVNRGGHYDEEFGPAAQGERRVVTIGDSFSAGVVPHPWHFTTVCEELLPGVRVDNMGVPATGPAEYLWMMRAEALPLDPDLVVVDLFVGNDIRPRIGLLRSWLERRNVLTWLVPVRLATLARERRATGRAAGSLPGERVLDERATDRAELARSFPWVADPSLEEPVFSERAFLELERHRARTACAPDPRDLEELFATLEDMRDAAGARLAVLLIPDEFQVEDALWAEVGFQSGVELERDAPQRRIGAWLAERGVPCLDLLPRLRAVPVGPDGQRHVYHRRDTHWNARGNRVAGEALAEFLVELGLASPAAASPR